MFIAVCVAVFVALSVIGGIAIVVHANASSRGSGICASLGGTDNSC